jgi:hypothetical protein
MHPLIVNFLQTYEMDMYQIKAAGKTCRF